MSYALLCSSSICFASIASLICRTPAPLWPFWDIVFSSNCSLCRASFLEFIFCALSSTTSPNFSKKHRRQMVKKLPI